VILFVADILTFVPETAISRARTVASREIITKKQAGTDRETFNWHIQRDEYGFKLCLQNANNERQLTSVEIISHTFRPKTRSTCRRRIVFPKPP